MRWRDGFVIVRAMMYLSRYVIARRCEVSFSWLMVEVFDVFFLCGLSPRRR